MFISLTFRDAHSETLKPEAYINSSKSLFLRLPAWSMRTLTSSFVSNFRYFSSMFRGFYFKHNSSFQHAFIKKAKADFARLTVEGSLPFDKSSARNALTSSVVIFSISFL